MLLKIVEYVFVHPFLLNNLFSTVKVAPLFQYYSFYMVEVGRGWILTMICHNRV